VTLLLRSESKQNCHHALAFPLSAELRAVTDLLRSTLNAVGSALLIWFPLQVRVLTERGEPALTFVGNAGPDGEKSGKRYARWSKAGPALLAIGFVVQIGVPSRKGFFRTPSARSLALRASLIDPKPPVDPSEVQRQVSESSSRSIPPSRTDSGHEVATR
jgi:hypothetical protein